jgi:hypothetical protein
LVQGAAALQTYPVRTSHKANLRPEALETLAKNSFGTSRREGEEVVASFGALESLKAHAEGKGLGITVVMNPKVPEDVQRETIRRYNQFLEEVTGFNAKERAKRARKSAAGT